MTLYTTMKTFLEYLRESAGQPTVYRGCTITPRSGQAKYFGVGLPGADEEGYLTNWVRVDFPDNTHVLSANTKTAEQYIDRYLSTHGTMA